MYDDEVTKKGYGIKLNDTSSLQKNGNGDVIVPEINNVNV